MSLRIAAMRTVLAAPVTAEEAAEAIGDTPQRVRKALSELVGRGYVEASRSGARSPARYFGTAEGREYSARYGAGPMARAWETRMQKEMARLQSPNDLLPPGDGKGVSCATAHGVNTVLRGRAGDGKGVSCATAHGVNTVLRVPGGTITQHRMR
ncbi:hypothetical protein [Sphingopyxis sp.]|uniref:hypothetical protein n=1 Tax=Sphingopyxis sp. TaxID=1908224 RepID=UPI0025FBBDA9|nr:hypothetical protein [Sphingopyxis sp.]MBK6414046.1 hypothetical protein [Sphingopyxis sp.]